MLELQVSSLYHTFAAQEDGMLNMHSAVLITSSFHLQARRHLLADQANAHDQKLYEDKQAQLDHEIEQASQALETHKAQLQQARAEKKRKLQYEVGVASVVTNQRKLLPAVYSALSMLFAGAKAEMCAIPQKIKNSSRN